MAANLAKTNLFNRPEMTATGGLLPGPAFQQHILRFYGWAEFIIPGGQGQTCNTPKNGPAFAPAE